MRLFRKTDILLNQIRNGETLSWKSQTSLAIQLSIPSMLAQLTIIVMEYIDAAMVGSLGADASAAIGLVSTSIWLFGGMCRTSSIGFSVQVAHLIGAGDENEAKNVVRQSIASTSILSLVFLAIGVSISGNLPVWLGGDETIISDASSYFLIYCLTLPLLQIYYLAGAMLRCSGNMHVPSMVNIVMCILDVIFNFFFIFPTREIAIGESTFAVYGMGLGVTGAALGTAIATAICTVFMVWFLVCKSDKLHLKGTQGRFMPTKRIVKKALNIGLPMWLEHSVFCGAQIVTTVIVAPLGNAAVAANAFGVIVESLCYMPGYGISESATTLVGQSLGAKRKDLAKSFAKITVSLGMAVMTIMGIAMYFTSPYIMQIMSPDDTVQQLTVNALRIEAFAEPMFAASIVAYGVFVGAGDTLIPCLMNLGSIWGVRISLALLLASTMGLNGVWLAMCIELCFRGIIFLIRLSGSRWTRNWQ